jgi:hypothetical protein
VIFNGSQAKALGVTIRNNGIGINLRTQSFLNTDAIISGNSGTGVFVHSNATVHCVGCTLAANGDHGIIVRRNSTVRFNAATVTGNTGGGVLLTEESSVFFPNVSNVTANVGGLDVACGASANSAKLATTNISGGTTNCIEPTDP